MHNEFDLEVPELETYELTKLTNHIIRRSNRAFPVKNFNFYRFTYENAWEKAWCLMISCGPDETFYQLAKKLLKEKLSDWEPLDEKFEKGIWKNTYSSILQNFLEQINGYGKLEQLRANKFSEYESDDVYEWLNTFYEKVCQYRQESDLRYERIIPNQEQTMCQIGELYLDKCESEELKTIAKEFSGRSRECNASDYVSVAVKGTSESGSSIGIAGVYPRGKLCKLVLGKLCGSVGIINNAHTVFDFYSNVVNYNVVCKFVVGF